MTEIKNAIHCTDLINYIKTDLRDDMVATCEQFSDVKWDLIESIKRIYADFCELEASELSDESYICYVCDDDNLEEHGGYTGSRELREPDAYGNMNSREVVFDAVDSDKFCDYVKERFGKGSYHLIF